MTNISLNCKSLLKLIFLLFILCFGILLIKHIESKNDNWINVSFNKIKLDKENNRYNINKDIYVFNGDDCHYTLVISGSEASLIDTGDAMRDFSRIMEFLNGNKLKLKNVFLTHMHEDHCANIIYYSDIKSKIIVPKSLKNNQIVKMGDKIFKAIKMPGHNSDEDVAIELVNEHMLVAGDIVVTNKIPLLCSEGTAQKFIKSLNYIKKQNYNIIVPGHGNIIRSDLAVNRVLEYFTNCFNYVKSIRKHKGSLGECLNKFTVKDSIKDASFMTEEYIKVMEPYHKSNLARIFESLLK